MLKALMYETQYKNYSPDFKMYESLLDRCIPVVEFGSGTGRISCHLLQKGYTVFGIEKDKDYKDYFIRKIENKNFAKRFKYINDVKDVNLPCNVIYPFNVIFYLNKRDLIKELSKLQGPFLNSVVIETDNIYKVNTDNLFIKEHTFDNFLFKEQPFQEKSKIRIHSEIFKNQRKIIEFNSNLYLHKAPLLLGLYGKYFNEVNFYGDFNMNKYSKYSTKLIALIKTRVLEI
jgi:hypothetical protein